MLQVSRDGSLFKKMSKLVSLGHQGKRRFFYLKVFYKGEGQSSSTFNWPMGLERSFKIPEDAIDVMAQIKRPTEDNTHPNAGVKRLKEMVRTPKEKK
jgi:hypothetical protein